MIVLPGYHVYEQIYESRNSRIYRARRNCDHQPVILKILKKDYPTPTELSRYKHEYDILGSLNLHGVIRAYDLQEYQHTLVLILEDFGGESLQNFIKVLRFTVEEGLILAIQLTKIVGKIHAVHVIHKNIHPSNIVWNPETGELKLIDFSMATVLPQESSALQHQDVLQGKLAYMSPEQTGRMNRAVDYRTDFYSLGVTLYKLLTKRLPFETTDPMELVHCHIVKQPVPPCEIRPEIPKAVSDIVLKLLAKTAEERYQTAWGIQADLEECLKQLRATGTVSDFSLARQDIPDRLHLSQKLYGREHEIATLLMVFERVSEGNREMMLISGYAGIGKTSLVHEISKSMMETRGYFISGKFDQLHHSMPYSAIIKAFQELVQHLLRESEAALRHWREKLVTALGSNGQVIIDVIPEVALVIGPQPPVPELGPVESQNRFTLVFQNFIRVFCQKEHPLVIFLDDMQWSDSASLKLITVMINDVDIHHFFFIGAYRENEVDAAHPLMRTLDTLRQKSGIVNKVALGALHLEHITQLLADTLRCDREALAPLANLVMHKTGGNPFFINQFLVTLYQENLLTFDVQQRRWTWDLAQINALDITDNVVNLMTGKLKKLPEPTQQVLRLAACIGNRFNLRILSIISEKTTTETFHDLFPAIQEDLIVPLSGLEISGGHPGDASFVMGEYEFLHDRVQQAAYALIEEDRRKAVHLMIGRLLLKNVTPQEQDKQIFVIVNQLNWGREFLTDRAEREKLAELNLLAGKKAKTATAYERATHYLTIGRELLEENFWNTQHTLTFKLYSEGAECEYLMGHFEQSGHMLDIAFAQSKTDLEKGHVYIAWLTQKAIQGTYTDAVSLGIDALNAFGIQLPGTKSSDEIDRGFQKELIWYQQHWAGKSIATLGNLPINEDPRHNIVMAILATMLDVAIIGLPEYLGILTITMVNYTIRHGNTPMSPFGYVFHAVVLLGLQEYDSAYQFAQLALKLNEDTVHNTKISCKLLTMFGLLNYSKNHLTESIAVFAKGYEAGLEVGDMLYAAYCTTLQGRAELAAGSCLSDCVTHNESILAVLKKMNNLPTYDVVQACHSCALNLQGKTTASTSFDHEYFSEWEYRQKYLTGHHIAFLDFYKLKSHYILEHYTEALMVLLDIELSVIDPQEEGEEARFYATLTLLQLYAKTPEEDQKIYDERIKRWHVVIQKLAEICPINFRAHDLMITAEQARVEGQDLEAMDLYDQAIAAARESELIHNEALANELAAKFWMERGKEKFARLYMTAAHHCYQHWGATAKVKDMERKYAHLLPFSAVDVQASPSMFAEDLDLRAVLKASQAISGEIHLEKLLAAIMRIIIEHAGAEKGLFILNADEQLTIEASVTADSDEVEILHSLPVEQSQEVSAAIVNYVNRTAEPVVLHNASQEGVFVQDPYVLEYQPKSILSIPVCYQDKIVGVLYLENNLTTHAFTEDRLTILNVLVAQAAISLENATLFERSKRGEEDLRKMNRELQEQNLFINTLINISPDVIYIYDLIDTKNIFVNEGIQRTLGYSEEDIKAMGVSVIPHLMHPEDFTRYRQKIFPKYAELQDGELFEHEYRMRHKHGAWRWLRSKELIFKRLPDGSPRQIFGVISNITERKQAEQALQESERKYRGLYNSVKDGIARADMEGHFLECNPAFLDMVGFTFEELQQFTYWQLIPSKWYQKIHDIIANQLLQQGYSDEFEAEWIKKDGDILPVSTRGWLVKDEQGTPLGIWAIIRDITDRKRAEEQLKNQNLLLEQAVQEKQREMEVLFDRLLRQEKLATIGQMAGSIAHELRNPLGAAKNSVFFLKRLWQRHQLDASNPKVKEHLELIDNELDTSERVIAYLLQMTRMKPPRKEHIDLRPITADAVARCHLPKGIHCSIELYPEPFLIWADPVQLRQVFINILTNAIQAIEGDGNITIRATQLTKDSATRIEIENDGTDIAPDVLDKVFEPLYTTKATGTGLGLSICKQIIEHHHGRMSIKSQLGQGTTVTIVLPDRE